MTQANEKGCMICGHTGKRPDDELCKFCDDPHYRRRLIAPPLHFNLSSDRKIIPPKRTTRTTVWKFELFVDGHYFGQSCKNFYTIEETLEGIGLLLAMWSDIKHVTKDHEPEYLKLDIEGGDRLFQSTASYTCTPENMVHKFVDDFLNTPTQENVPHSSKYLISVEAHWGGA